MLAMIIAISCLVLTAVLGISLAIYNLRDEASREYRLEKRKRERKARRRPWVWPR